KAIFANARHRCHEFSVDGIAQKWSDFIHQTAIPMWQNWHQKSSIHRRLFSLQKKGKMKLYHYKNQLDSKLLKS
ncbi:MAG: hypothetical protein AAGH78_13580, partial [Cyanobacteria bacterium P01_H01_bin.58]